MCKIHLQSPRCGLTFVRLQNGYLITSSKYWNRVRLNVHIASVPLLKQIFSCPDYFDAVIMDFVDENCLVFDNDEENKFIYTDLHNQFKEIVRYC